MQVDLAPEQQAQLETLAKQQGKPPETVAAELLALGLSRQQEILDKKQEIRARLTERLEAYESGRAETIDAEEVFARLRRKSAALRSKSGA